MSASRHRNRTRRTNSGAAARARPPPASRRGAKPPSLPTGRPVPARQCRYYDENRRRCPVSRAAVPKLTTRPEKNPYPLKSDN